MNITAIEILRKDDRFRYQLLSRMKSDCDYYLGCGNRCRKHLWADSEEEQIALMKTLWRSFPEKPEWLSWEKILEYERKMCPTPEETEKQEIVSLPDASTCTMDEVLRAYGELSVLLYRLIRERADTNTSLNGGASACVNLPGIQTAAQTRLPQLHSFWLRTFECPECGIRITAPKGQSAALPNEHLKRLYCPRCKTEREFIRILMEIA